MWDVDTGNVVHSTITTEPINAVAFRPDGEWLALGGDDGTVRLWDVEYGEELTILDPQNDITQTRLGDVEGPVLSIAFSPDGKRLASGGKGGLVWQWNLATGRYTSIRTGHNGPVLSVAFSPDGKRLASGGEDGTVRLWIGETIVLRGHAGPVNSVAFSPDGEWLASGSSDRSVRLWDMVSPDIRPIVLQEHEDWVYAVAFDLDDPFLVSGGADRSVRLWYIDAEGLAEGVCDVVSRDLTREEWLNYVGEDIPFSDYEPCNANAQEDL